MKNLFSFKKKKMLTRSSSTSIQPYSPTIKKIRSLDSLYEVKKTNLIYLLSYFLFKKKENHEFFLKKLFQKNIIHENEISEIFL